MAQQKKVFIVRLSEDGICREVFTNVKALHDFISCNVWYSPLNIYDECKYSYANLVKALKKYEELHIVCEDGGSINIVEAKIISKY